MIILVDASLVFFTFQHLVFALKFFIAYLVPDEPDWIRANKARINCISRVCKHIEREQSARHDYRSQAILYDSYYRLQAVLCFNPSQSDFAIENRSRLQEEDLDLQGPSAIEMQLAWFQMKKVVLILIFIFLHAYGGGATDVRRNWPAADEEPDPIGDDVDVDDEVDESVEVDVADKRLVAAVRPVASISSSPEQTATTFGTKMKTSVEQVEKIC